MAPSLHVILLLVPMLTSAKVFRIAPRDAELSNCSVPLGLGVTAHNGVTGGGALRDTRFRKFWKGRVCVCARKDGAICRAHVLACRSIADLM